MTYTNNSPGSRRWSTTATAGGGSEIYSVERPQESPSGDRGSKIYSVEKNQLSSSGSASAVELKPIGKSRQKEKKEKTHIDTKLLFSADVVRNNKSDELTQIEGPCLPSLVNAGRQTATNSHDLKEYSAELVNGWIPLTKGAQSDQEAIGCMYRAYRQPNAVNGPPVANAELPASIGLSRFSRIVNRIFQSIGIEFVQTSPEDRFALGLLKLQQKNKRHIRIFTQSRTKAFLKYAINRKKFTSFITELKKAIRRGDKSSKNVQSLYNSNIHFLSLEFVKKPRGGDMAPYKINLNVKAECRTKVASHIINSIYSRDGAYKGDITFKISPATDNPLDNVIIYINDGRDMGRIIKNLQSYQARNRNDFRDEVALPTQKISSGISVSRDVSTSVVDKLKQEASSLAEAGLIDRKFNESIQKKNTWSTGRAIATIVHLAQLKAKHEFAENPNAGQVVDISNANYKTFLRRTVEEMLIRVELEENFTSKIYTPDTLLH